LFSDPPPQEEVEEVPPPATLQTLEETLRPSIQAPSIGKNLPSNMVALLHEWRSRGLGRFVSFDQKLWTGSVRGRFGKRQYIFNSISEKSVMDGTTLDVAAKALDRSKGKMSMNNFWKEAKASDDTVVRRNRRPRDDDDEVEVWQAPAPQAAPAARKRQRGHCPPHPSAPPGFIPGGHPGNRGNPFPMMNGNQPMPWGRQNVAWENTGRTSGHRGMGDL
jgi:hypothetical protein